MWAGRRSCYQTLISKDAASPPERASKLEWLSKTSTALWGHCKNVILIWGKERQGLHWVGLCISWEGQAEIAIFPEREKIPRELHGLLSLCLLSGCRRRILKCKQRAFGLGAKYWHCHFVAFMPEMWFLPFYHRAKRIVCLLKQSLLSHLNCFYLNHKLDRKNNF